MLAVVAPLLLSTSALVGRRALLSTGAAAAISSSTTTFAASAREGDAQFTNVATQVGGDDFTALPTGVKFKEVRLGTGPQVKQGDTVSVQFSGRCLNLNGKKFISTQDPAALATGLAMSEAFIWKVGDGSVIAGLDQAVVGMSKGGYRRIVIPEKLGYDSAMSLKPLPDNFQDLRSLESIVKNTNRDASLLFDVSLERVK